MCRFCGTVPHLSFVIPSGSEESSAWMLHCVQHDSVEHAARFFLSFRAPFPCHSEHPFLVIPRGSEESSAWMLHCVQHDSVEHAARFFLSFRAPFPCHSEHLFLVIPRGSEESSAWMLHCVIPSTFSLSFRAVVRNPVHGCFTAFSMTA
jgi:hypothetical protein